MKKVLVFTQDRWAFGSLFTGLSKELFRYNIYFNILNWSHSYTYQEFKYLDKAYDLFVTHPAGVEHLVNSGITLDKIAITAHSQHELLDPLVGDKAYFVKDARQYGVISTELVEKAQELGIGRSPLLTPLGITFDAYYNKPATKLSSVGYTGRTETLNFYGQEIKRGALVEKVISNIPFIPLIKSEHLHFYCMPAFYTEFDALIMSSVEEGGGLPVMEAAAAGRLPFGTPVGLFRENGPLGGGVLLPKEENQFVKELQLKLLYYYHNPEKFRDKCNEVQQYARDNYDWSTVVEHWLAFLE